MIAARRNFRAFPGRRAGFFCLLPAVLALSQPAEAANYSVLTYTSITFTGLAVRFGTVALNPTTAAMSGAGYISSVSALRGTVVISRTAAVAVSVTSIVPPANIVCGGVTVPVTAMPYDDSACTTAALGVCTIYVGITLSPPSTLPAGTCTAQTLDITVG